MRPQRFRGSRLLRALDRHLPVTVMLAPGYSTHQRVTVERAARLLAACDVALLDDGASISSFEADRRAQGVAPGASESGRSARCRL